MKLVSEKVSKLKLGPRGNMDLPVGGGAPAIGPKEEAQKLQDPTSSCSTLSIGRGFGITSDAEELLCSLVFVSIVYRLSSMAWA